MDDQSEIHNRLAGAIVVSIVKLPLMAGGSPTNVLALLESVVTGVLLALVNLGGDEKVLDLLTEGVRKRMAEIRLGRTEVGGNA